MIVQTDDENLLHLYREGRSNSKEYKRLPKESSRDLLKMAADFYKSHGQRKYKHYEYQTH